MNNFKEIIQFIRSLYNEPIGFIPLHSPTFKGNEKRYLEECINSTFVSSVGRFVDQFEIEFAKYTGAKKAVACVNGTSALHLALKLIGVEAGHEVITQALTFIATANAITYCCAKPIFIDVDLDTMGLSPDKLEHWLKRNITFKKNDRTDSDVKPINKSTGKIISACIPMHTFGHPCRIDEIVEICTHFHIPVVEDAAESLGSFYKNKHTGTYGNIGVLSFNGNKIITTGGGGMLLFQNEELAIYAKHLTTQAKVPHSWEFSHDETGFNYRMPNINAAIGLAQMEQIVNFLTSKRNIATQYQQFFKKHNIRCISEPCYASSNYWLNCILFDDKANRDAFLKYSYENNVMTRPAWNLMNKQAMFSACQSDSLQNSEFISERLVNLPSSVIS